MPFDKMHFFLDVTFSLDTNIGIFFDELGKTMLQQMLFTQDVLFRKRDSITICDNPIPVSRFYPFCRCFTMYNVLSFYALIMSIYAMC